MDPQTFISHSETGGPETSRSIQQRLRHPDLSLGSFFSQDDMVAGDDFNEKIIRNIVGADILIGVIDADAKDSPWVKWEHEFCRERNLTTICIIFPSIRRLFHQISFISSSVLVIHYDRGRDIMLDEIFDSILTHKPTLVQRVEQKQKVHIDASTEKDSYLQDETVLIKGSVNREGVQESSKFSISQLCLHRPNHNSNDPPIVTDVIANPIELNEKNEFELTFPLSYIVPECKKWFIEIRFDNKSEILPIRVCPSILPTESETAPPHPPTESEKSPWKEKIKSFSKGTFQSIPKKIRYYSISRENEVNDILNKI